MKIQLKSISLRNFKGIRSLDIDFDQVTNIYGDNGTGKTTVFDAFHWLLFGKDSQDRADFNIKTLGPDNKPYHHLDHEVSASLLIDGTPLNLRRIFNENWVKKRGQEKQEFSGHTTSYFWNDVPMSKADYESKINNHIDSSIFKLVTNTSYFNALNWTDRRSILLKSSGEVSNDQVLEDITTLSNKAQFDALISALNQGKTLDEFKREVASKKKRIKDELSLIPARIDEANRSLPEPLNYTAIQADVDLKKADLQRLDDELTSFSKKAEGQKQRLQALLNERQDLMLKASDIEGEIRQSVRANLIQKKTLLAEMKSQKLAKQEELKSLEQKKADQIKQKVQAHETIRVRTQSADTLREKWRQVNAEEITFDESKFTCPTCLRPYEEHDIEQSKEKMLENFKQDKAKRLAEISQKGKMLKQEIEHLQSLINNIDSDSEERELSIVAAKNSIIDLQDKIQTVQSDIDRLEIDIEPATQIAISKNEQLQFMVSNIRELKEKIEAPEEGQDNSDYVNQKKRVQLELESLQKQLSSKETRERILFRILELEQQEKTLAQELADLEAIELTIEEFTVAKMNALEASLNDRFELVKFKLFNTQINGGRTETCETLINGVPYSDANTASKINAGLDIINTLSKFYKVTAPVFIDNAESVNELISSESQIIRLVVSHEKALKISGVSAEKTRDYASQSSAN